MPLPLAPGTHVLENRPLGADSPKADRVRAALAGINTCRGPALIEALYQILGSHDAACVHAGPYGTRSAVILIVPPDPDMPPRLHYSEGPPCTAPLRDATSWW